MGVPGQGEPSAGGLRTSSAPADLLGLEPAGPHREAGLAASTITGAGVLIISLSVSVSVSELLLYENYWIRFLGK